MTSRREFLKKSALGIAGIAVAPTLLKGQRQAVFSSQRPRLGERCFTSKAVEIQIQKIKAQIKDAKLAWMFENCYPNTLDTTVQFGKRNGKPDTFVITGDINAMWLRDSAAQVFPYLPLAKQDAKLQEMLRGVIHRQMYCIQIDRYANAFNKKALPKEQNHWSSD
ncbi:MAG: metal-independent alpha-mannosidase, partial [Draconibacterium sp.]